MISAQYMEKIMTENRRVLTVVMDGIGARESSFGNAVKMAETP